jgi:acyl-CoA hydrolase/ribosomal protein S18 acetylase RimI-like enzyme
MIETSGSQFIMTGLRPGELRLRQGKNQKPRALYESRRSTADEALEVVRSGHRILVGSGCSAPQELLRALVHQAPRLADVELVHLLTFGIAPYVDEKYNGVFRHNAFFMGKNVRDAVNEGRADFTPIFLSEVPNLFYSGRMRLDIALVMVSPPDAFGYCSLGIHPDIVISGIETARTAVIAQVNRHMPRTHGDTFVHVSKIDHFVEHDEPLLELPAKPVDETSMAIARHVASLVENEATLQLGIGDIPNGVLMLLDDRRDLGIHTEMMSDGVMDLIEKGVITNERKGLHPSKTVASFAMGSQKLYDYLDDNPCFEFHPTEYVNSPRVIAQNNKMVSINSGIQIDLTGQVCADSMGSKFYSGIGGQVDFVRGAAMSPGGKPIIALPSTAKGGTVSRIVPMLDPGAGVVTSRGDVHYVVTEFGIAYLHGETIRERAMALIEVAHPDFRQELRAAAVERHCVPVEWELPTEANRYPSDMEVRRGFGDKKFLVRPLRSSDVDRLMEFFYSHDPDTIYGRYRYAKKSLPREEAMRLCTLDYSKMFALCVFSQEGNYEHIIAIGRYTMNERNRFAETAIVVHQNYRRLGIASYLYDRLREQAQRNGILGFMDDSFPSNKAAFGFHRKRGSEAYFDAESGVYRYIERFKPEVDTKEQESSKAGTA